MTSTEHGVFARSWKDIASAFLRLGATSYGGPAIMGIMQAELQEKRQWVSKERFVEGLSLVNMLPGATATQLGSMFTSERPSTNRSLETHCRFSCSSACMMPMMAGPP